MCMSFFSLHCLPAARMSRIVLFSFSVIEKTSSRLVATRGGKKNVFDYLTVIRFSHLKRNSALPSEWTVTCVTSRHHACSFQTSMGPAWRRRFSTYFFTVHDRLATVWTKTVGGGCWDDFYRRDLDFWRQSVSAAESFDCIFRDAQRIRNFRIAPSSFPQVSQAVFLIKRHQVSLQLLKWFTFLRLKVESFYSAKNKKRSPMGKDPHLAVILAVAQVLANIT